MLQRSAISGRDWLSLGGSGILYIVYCIGFKVYSWENYSKQTRDFGILKSFVTRRPNPLRGIRKAFTLDALSNKEANLFSKS